MIHSGSMKNVPEKKTILVTGGAGYIGSHTVRALLDQGFEVVVLDNLVYGHRRFVPRGTKFVKADLKDKRKLDSVFKKHQISAAIHFAAYTYVGESMKNPSKYFNNNISNTLNLLDAMVSNSVKHIVFSSSCAVYGIPTVVPITEREKRDPINPYGFTKLVVERMLDAYDIAYGTKSVSLRYFNAAGADSKGKVGEWHEPETHAIPLIFKAISDPGYTFSVFGNDYPTKDGSCIRDYIHVSDLADAHVKALIHLLNGGATERLNLGTGVGVSVFELIKSAEQASGGRVKFTVSPRREGDPSMLVADASMANSVLNWGATRTIDDIMRDAWNWHCKLNKIKA